MALGARLLPTRWSGQLDRFSYTAEPLSELDVSVPLTDPRLFKRQHTLIKPVTQLSQGIGTHPTQHLTGWAHATHNTILA